MFNTLQSFSKKSLLMAHLASSAYSTHCQSTFASYGFNSDYQELSNKHTHAYVACNSKQILIAIKGTNPRQLTDFLADADIWPTIDGYSWVHRGFKKRGDSLLAQVIKYIKQHPNKEIYITGHSLGAAIGVYITGELENLGYGPICLFTFGCPRVGNKEYVSLIKSPHYRFVNCNDLVARVPWAVIGYRHHGTLHYINFYGEIRSLTVWQIIKDRFRARLTALQKGKIFNSLSDHKIGSYIKHLQELAEE